MLDLSVRNWNLLQKEFHKCQCLETGGAILRRRSLGRLPIKRPISLSTSVRFHKSEAIGGLNKGTARIKP